MVAVKLLRALLANSILVLPTASGTNGTLQVEFVVTWTIIIIIIILCLSGFYPLPIGARVWAIVFSIAIHVSVHWVHWYLRER